MEYYTKDQAQKIALFAYNKGATETYAGDFDKHFSSDEEFADVLVHMSGEQPEDIYGTVRGTISALIEELDKSTNEAVEKIKRFQNELNSKFGSPDYRSYKLAVDAYKNSELAERERCLIMKNMCCVWQAEALADALALIDGSVQND